jgi:hypothetical protein
VASGMGLEVLLGERATPNFPNSLSDSGVFVTETY